MMAQAGKTIAGGAVPRQVNATYTTFPKWFILTFALCQFGAVAGPFFGIQGPEGQWPYAWWAFGLIANAIWPFFVFTHTLVRTPESMTMMGLYVGKVSEIPLDGIESMEVKKGCFGFSVKLTYTEAAYEAAKKEGGACGCCVSKSTEIAFLATEDLNAFLADHGLSAASVEMPVAAVAVDGDGSA